jgi:hypothetical protein
VCFKLKLGRNCDRTYKTCSQNSRFFDTDIMLSGCFEVSLAALTPWRLQLSASKLSGYIGVTRCENVLKVLDDTFNKSH